MLHKVTRDHTAQDDIQKCTRTAVLNHAHGLSFHHGTSSALMAEEEMAQNTLIKTVEFGQHALGCRV